MGLRSKPFIGRYSSAYVTFVVPKVQSKSYNERFGTGDNSDTSNFHLLETHLLFSHLIKIIMEYFSPFMVLLYESQLEVT
jgi:hypothetical protein